MTTTTAASKKEEKAKIETPVILEIENEVIKCKPPRHLKNTNVYQFTLRFLDRAHLSTNKKPPYKVYSFPLMC